MATLADSLSGQAALVITTSTDDTCTLADATLTGAKVLELDGQAVKWSFQFTGGAFTSP